MKKTTREWVRKAEKDYRAAARLAASRESFPDQICFFCQQSAEKYLKALLEELSRSIPKTHDLDQLSNLLLTFHPGLRSLRRGLLFLTDFAVDIRYPGNNASRREATSALRWAGRVREACRATLGLRPPRRRKPS
jgi:HEPN domain-containing protein